MARTKTLKTTSIIMTRAQTRTGTNVRTNDDPVATGRTTGTNRMTDPVPPVVTTTDPVDLFAGRPKTSALKNPPPVPRDRDSDSSDDDAKKPAAKPASKPKPKGRPKKVAPKATRKPRIDANELVDPMSRVHVGDDATGAVTAGGLARAGGNDPVLANPEQDPEPLNEPQPKKKTRRAVDQTRASRRPR